MTQDLICPNETGYPLVIEGSNIIFDGNGHKIVGPQAFAGIFVQGSNITVQNVNAQGFQAYGIFAYNTPGIQLIGNNTSNNHVGLEIYTDSPTVNQALILGNISTGNSAYGAFTGQGNSGQIINPIFSGNDFSNSQSFALAVEATQFEYNGFLEFNKMTGSQNGLFLVGGTFNIHDLDLSQQQFQKIGIFGQEASSISLTNVNCSTTLAPNSLSEHTGVDFYEVQNFVINGYTSNNTDTGLRFETEQGVSCAGTIENSTFKNNDGVGISIISYDSTAYGLITLANNTFVESSGISDWTLANGTVADLVQSVIANNGNNQKHSSCH
jgi:hypothetical protein